MADKILLVTGDAGECYETLYAKHRFLEAGLVPVIASSSKRRLNLVIHDSEPGWDTYKESPGYIVAADATFAEVKAADYVGVMLLGGRAPEYLRNDRRLIALVKEFDRQGRWIFAICHGIQILVAAGLAKGARVTCYEHVRHEVETNGGTWVDQQSLRHGRLVTSQTWHSHPEFYRDVFACLAETAKGGKAPKAKARSQKG